MKICLGKIGHREQLLVLRLREAFTKLLYNLGCQSVNDNIFRGDILTSSGSKEQKLDEIQHFKTIKNLIFKKISIFQEKVYKIRKNEMRVIAEGYRTFSQTICKKKQLNRAKSPINFFTEFNIFQGRRLQNSQKKTDKCFFFGP